MQYGHVNGACLNEMNVAFGWIVRLLRPFYQLSLKVEETRTQQNHNRPHGKPDGYGVQDALSAVWKIAAAPSKITVVKTTKLQRIVSF